MTQSLPVYPMRIWRGTTSPPFIVELPIDGAGSAFQLDIVLADDTRLLLSTSDASLTAAPVVVEGETWTRVTWPRTLAQSQLVPIGPRAGQYELKQTEPSGGIRPWLCGEVIGIGGLSMADVLRVIEGPQINVVEVLVIGPQGIQGDKGDKGDTGDVTPEAEAALLQIQQVQAAFLGRLDFSNPYQSGWL